MAAKERATSSDPPAEESVWLDQQMKLKLCAKARGPLDPETVECREGFLTSSVTLLEVYIRGNHENAGKIERAIWKHGFYVPITEFRMNRKRVVDGFSEFIEQAVAWYVHLLERVHVIKASNPGPNGDIDVTMSRCYVYIGDLYRYKIQHVSFSRKDVSESRDAYVNAVQLWPIMGNSYNQLAVLCSVAEDPFRSLFYYIRSATAREPFPSADENMAMFLHKTLQGDVKLKKQKGKNGMQEVETILGNTCLVIVAMLYLQIDIDSVLEVWSGGSSIIEEYLNRRLQKIRKSAANGKPVFGKSKKVEELTIQQSKVFQDPPHALIMMVQSLLLLMQGKLEHAKCADNLRSTLSRSYGYIVVLDVIGRIASLVGRCRPLLKQSHHPACIDLMVSDILMPLLLLLSWIAKDWQVHKESSLKALEHVSDSSRVDQALKKFFRGLLSMAHAMSHVREDVASDTGKLSRLSRTGIIHGCPLLETMMDYPLLVVKRQWEREHEIPFGSRKQRRKAHGLHLGSWTVIHNVWTMILDISEQLHQGPVASYLGDRYNILRMKLHDVTTQQKNIPKHDQEPRVLDTAQQEEQQEDIVYVARKPKRPPSRGPERMQDVWLDEPIANEYYNTCCLASEMAEEVLADEDHVGPSDEYLRCTATPGSDFGNMLHHVE